MKQLKTILSALCLTILMFAFTSCGSDDDEPKDPNESEIDGLSVVNPDVLPGTWQIVSITDDETKETTTINKTVTIKDFDVIQKDATVTAAADYEIWLQPYKNLVYTTDQDELNDLSIMFYNKRGSSISNAKIYEFSFSFNNENNMSVIVVGNNLSFSNKTLIADAGLYQYSYLDENNNLKLVQLIGKMTMKKL